MQKSGSFFYCGESGEFPEPASFHCQYIWWTNKYLNMFHEINSTDKGLVYFLLMRWQVFCVVCVTVLLSEVVRPTPRADRNIKGARQGYCLECCPYVTAERVIDYPELTHCNTEMRSYPHTSNFQLYLGDLYRNYSLLSVASIGRGDTKRLMACCWHAISHLPKQYLTSFRMSLTKHC